MALSDVQWPTIHYSPTELPSQYCYVLYYSVLIVT